MAAGVPMAETDHLREIPLWTMGMWVFLAGEIMVFFGGLITAYILVRAAHGGFGAQVAEHMSWRTGAFNTLILDTSSLTMVLAAAGARMHDLRRTRLFLSATVGLGVLFFAIKMLEWASHISAGLTPASGAFWAFYYLMTGLHAGHVLAGIVINTVLLVMVVRERPWATLEGRIKGGALYWDFVDVVWVFLFPLLYLWT